jgi:hypothetical protein
MHFTASPASRWCGRMLAESGDFLIGWAGMISRCARRSEHSLQRILAALESVLFFQLPQCLRHFRLEAVFLIH